MRLLCLVGIHRPVWVPTVVPAGAPWSPPVRKCQHCPKVLGRTHRE